MLLCLICAMFLSPTKDFCSVFTQWHRKASHGEGMKDTLQKSVTEFYKGLSQTPTAPETIRKTNIHLSNSIYVLFPTFMVVIYCVRFLPNCWLLLANDYHNTNIHIYYSGSGHERLHKITAMQ